MTANALNFNLLRDQLRAEFGDAGETFDVVIVAAMVAAGCDELRRFMEEVVRGAELDTTGRENIEPLMSVEDPRKLFLARLERLREVVLQTHIACGWPRVIDALTTLRAVLDRNTQRELATELAPSRDDAALANWKEAGSARFALVYDDQTVLVRTILRRGSPALEQAIVCGVYGAIMSDDSLISLRTREMALLAALRVAGAHTQLPGHTRAAHRLGVTQVQVDAIFAVASEIQKCVALQTYNKLFPEEVPSC